MSSSTCDICNSECLVVSRKGVTVITHQSIHNVPRYDNIIGPDTALCNYQRARERMDWAEADRIVELCKKNGMVPAWMKTHYEMHSMGKRQLVEEWEK